MNEYICFSTVFYEEYYTLHTYKRYEDIHVYVHAGEWKIIITRVELVNDELITSCPCEGRSPRMAF